MDYKTVVGQEVIRYDGAKGVIKEVDKQGAIHIKYEKDIFDGGYLFDPFVSEEVRFVNDELQKVIDDKIEEITKSQLEIINKSMARNKEEETYYITKKNYNGQDEIVLSLKCDLKDAKIAFSYIIKEQQREMRRDRFGFKWHQVKLFESKTNKKIAQES